ncbi:MAG: MBOAT family protein [Butyrivibrio sp.]|nr:MBOAT family protein [Butyrivibrio sp.]
MVFSSGVFLFIFLPIVLLAHTLIKNNSVRNGLLIAASLVFYAWGEPVYVLLLLASVGVNYLFGSLLSSRKSRGLMALAAVFNLSLLAVFKYAGFLVETLNGLPFVNLPVPDITMPIGISFFTFQAISYVADTYRADGGEKTSFASVLLYISLFPQLIAGPIVKYNGVKEQIAKRSVTADRLASGIRRFVIGLSKKMLLANPIGFAADRIFKMDAAAIDTPLAWLGAVCYTLQIYFDFSGYSDMAVGLGKCMGFDFPENFDYPYAAAGIRSFWRKWHMSLTGWFREYLYIPLGGNRKGRGRQILNTMIVFVCTGIWHGANLTFILWGFLHGALMSVETLLTRGGKPAGGILKPLKWLCTMLFVILGFVIFRSDTVGGAFAYIGRMFAFVRLESADTVLMSCLTPVFLLTLSAALIACFPIVPRAAGALKGKRIYGAASAVCYGLTFALYLLCVMTLAADSYNPFIYFRF